MFDVIVVGARCAGSPVAMLLARRGHRVLMVDRSSFPSDAVSTHYIHQAGLSRLQAWGLLDEVIDAKTPAIRKMNYANHGIPLIGFADPIDGIDAVYCPRRVVLDEILVNAARRAGVEVLEQFTVSDLVFSDVGWSASGARGRRARAGVPVHRGGRRRRVPLDGGQEGRRGAVQRAARRRLHLLLLLQRPGLGSAPQDRLPRAVVRHLADQRRRQHGRRHLRPAGRSRSSARTPRPGSWRSSTMSTRRWARSCGTTAAGEPLRPCDTPTTTTVARTGRAGRWSVTPATTRTPSRAGA